jgi:hypothetical protein
MSSSTSSTAPQSSLVQTVAAFVATKTDQKPADVECVENVELADGRALTFTTPAGRFVAYTDDRGVNAVMTDGTDAGGDVWTRPADAPKTKRTRTAKPKTEPTTTDVAPETEPTSEPTTEPPSEPSEPKRTRKPRTTTPTTDAPTADASAKKPAGVRMADAAHADVTRRANAILVAMLDGKKRAPISSRQMAALVHDLGKPTQRVVDALNAAHRAATKDAPEDATHKLVTAPKAKDAAPITAHDLLALNKTHGRKIKVVSRAVVGVDVEKTRRDVAAVSSAVFDLGGSFKRTDGAASTGNKMRGAKMIAALAAIAEHEYAA